MVIDGTIGGALKYWGLSHIPKYKDMDQEFMRNEFDRIAKQTQPEDYFSFKNRMLLFNAISVLGLDMYSSEERSIYEIGVGFEERAVNTSTFMLAKVKHNNVFYLGIDPNKRHWIGDLHDPSICLLEERSEDVLKRWKRNSKYSNNKRADLLHIDGSHSVNGVLNDWEFTEYVKDTGIILLHDIKAHPGPKLLVEAIDRDIYTVHKMFLNDPKDFGMAVVYKKENDYGRIIDWFA